MYGVSKNSGTLLVNHRGVPMKTENEESLHTILLVDDEEPVRESLEILLEDRYYILQAQSGEKALKLLKKHQVDLVILDVTMPGMGGITTLEKITELPGAPEVVMLSASDTARLGAQSVKMGAFDYIAKPFNSDDLLEVIRRALEKKRLEREVHYLRSEVEKLGGFGDIVGKSPPMKQVFRIVQKISQTDSNVLITGESGTGKELIARAIHSRGTRCDGPFIPVNCAAIPQELLESEFFGHEKGSFTGAHERKIGKFELAHRGILFLDEISTLRQNLQAKLLRILQEGEFMRVGGSRSIHVDVQIIAATNQNLKQMVTESTFREDLYYRLNVLPIKLPPLRERRSDISLLVEHFLGDIGYRLNRKTSGVTPEVMKLLESYHWPGNIRELENLLERLVAFSSDDASIGIENLPMEIVMPKDNNSQSQHPPEGLPEAKERFEKMYLISALRKTGWNQSEAARILGIHRNTLLKKMASYDITSAEE